jgi:hypothetical protein
MGTHAPQAVTHCFVTTDMKAGHRYVVLSKLDAELLPDATNVTPFDATVHVALVDETTGETIPDQQCAYQGP